MPVSARLGIMGPKAVAPRSSSAEAFGEDSGLGTGVPAPKASPNYEASLKAA